jgi:uncharacterized protein YecT (DUF1311 family)
MKPLLILILSLYFTPTCFGQVNLSDSNLIDIRLKACLDSDENGTTVGIMGCTYRAENSWDAEMNKYYQQLKSLLTPVEMEKLKTSQIKWLEFRDAEFSTSDLIYNDMQGTMWPIVRADSQMEIVRQRALELKYYYESLTQH